MSVSGFLCFPAPVCPVKQTNYTPLTCFHWCLFKKRRPPVTNGGMWGAGGEFTYRQRSIDVSWLRVQQFPPVKCKCDQVQGLLSMVSMQMSSSNVQGATQCSWPAAAASTTLLPPSLCSSAQGRSAVSGRGTSNRQPWNHLLWTATCSLGGNRKVRLLDFVSRAFTFQVIVHVSRIFCRVWALNQLFLL